MQMIHWKYMFNSATSRVINYKVHTLNVTCISKMYYFIIQVIPMKILMVIQTRELILLVIHIYLSSVVRLRCPDWRSTNWYECFFSFWRNLRIIFIHPHVLSFAIIDECLNIEYNPSELPIMCTITSAPAGCW